MLIRRYAAHIRYAYHALHAMYSAADTPLAMPPPLCLLSLIIYTLMLYADAGFAMPPIRAFLRFDVAAAAGR